MAIRNLFARGIGFANGAIRWVVTRGFSSSTPIVAPTFAQLANTRDVTPSTRSFNVTPGIRWAEVTPRTRSFTVTPSTSSREVI